MLVKTMATETIVNLICPRRTLAEFVVMQPDLLVEGVGIYATVCLIKRDFLHLVVVMRYSSV